MDNKDFKVRIIDFYKDVDKPIINTLYNDEQTKNVLELSTKTQFPLLKKDKDKWIIKDKRKILKEIDVVKKKKVKEIKSTFTKLTNESTNLNDIKNSNNKLLADLETIDNLKKNIDNDDLYLRLQNLTSKNYENNYKKEKKDKKEEKERKKDKLEQKGGFKEIKIVDINENTHINIPFRTSKSNFVPKTNAANLSEISQLSSDTNDYIEVFSN
jgi:hypothetical protein